MPLPYTCCSLCPQEMSPQAWQLPRGWQSKEPFTWHISPLHQCCLCTTLCNMTSSPIPKENIVLKLARVLHAPKGSVGFDRMPAQAMSFFSLINCALLSYGMAGSCPCTICSKGTASPQFVFHLSSIIHLYNHNLMMLLILDSFKPHT